MRVESSQELTVEGRSCSLCLSHTWAPCNTIASTTTLTSGHWACIGVMRFTQRSYTFALQILSIPLMFLLFILPETKEDKDRPPTPHTHRLFSYIIKELGEQEQRISLKVRIILSAFLLSVFFHFFPSKLLTIMCHIL